jgi:O-antigen ligase
MAIAIAPPFLLAYSAPPSPTVLNQLLALAGWGLVVAQVACQSGFVGWRARALLPATAALVVLFVASLAAALLGSVVKGPALAFAAMVAAAAATLLAAAASAAGEPGMHAARMRAFHCALVAAGALSAIIACLQIFIPSWSDGVWIAGTNGGGRAVGNVRQSNHLGTLLLFSMAALATMVHDQRLPRKAAWALSALLMLGLVLSGSRAGMLGLLVLVIWGLADTRLARPARALLLAAPLLYGAAWMGVLVWADATGAALSSAQRLASTGGESTTNRLIAWRNALDLIAAHPWRGVGFGEFNFALSLTPFDQRSAESPTHAHNLPLHLAVELGLPLAVLVVGLLAASLIQAWRASWRMRGEAAVGTRAAFMMLMLIAIHSQLEYPLWYAYFLLPMAWALGVCLGSTTAQPNPIGAGLPRGGARAGLGFMLAGVAMAVASALAFVDYRRVSAAFLADGPPKPSAARFAAAQQSWFFAHHADYAAAVTAKQHADEPLAFSRAPHYVLDAQMLRAWSLALAQQGDIDRARHVAQRLSELGTPAAEAFFAPCVDASVEPKPYQCELPKRAMDWRHFRWLGAGG